MPVIKFLKWTIETINSHMVNFFWDDQEDHYKYHLANFQSLWQKKEEGGLGISDLRNLNLCLLVSWVQRYHDFNSKLWKQIIDCKLPTSSAALREMSLPFRKGFFGLPKQQRWASDSRWEMA
jgi:hypothetical protein